MTKDNGNGDPSPGRPPGELVELRTRRGTGLSTPIYTVGYGARSFEAFVALLQEHGIDCLVDVRSAPHSRFRPEFSREALETVLRDRGVRYVFLGDALGGRPADPDCYVNGRVEYERVRAKDVYRQGIERLRRAAAQGICLTVMCAEGRPEECHRSKLIGVSLEELGISVVHLDENDECQSQAAVIRRLTGGQLDLFGEAAFTSRRRYDAKDEGEAA